MTDRRLIKSEINIASLLKSMDNTEGQSGATVVFAGSVRNSGKAGPVTEMYYEAYEKMAEITLKEIEQYAMKMWNVNNVRIIHRTGRLHLGDISVVIVLSTMHSREAFEACEQILAMVKQRVPIWKKELLSNGQEQWVDGKQIHESYNSNH